jgi:hypothetical protein
MVDGEEPSPYSGLQKYSPSAETSENRAGAKKSPTHEGARVFLRCMYEKDITKIARRMERMEI